MGMAIFIGLTVPAWVERYPGAIQTGILCLHNNECT